MFVVYSLYYSTAQYRPSLVYYSALLEFCSIYYSTYYRMTNYHKFASAVLRAVRMALI
jgi:hypothetical protein